MLERLLRLVAEGGIHSYQDLAARLAVPASLLDGMLQDLSRLGYLKPVAGGCAGGCVGCSPGGCAASRPGRLWTLTEKGRRAAARLAG